MLPLALLASPKNAALAALAALCLALSIGLYVRGVQLSAQRTKADALAQRLVNADTTNKGLTAGLTECAAINGRNSLRLAEQNQAIAAMRAESERTEAEAAERIDKLRRTAQEARQRDEARRARIDLPTAQEMTEALRDAAG
jgi:hypothetical protein